MRPLANTFKVCSTLCVSQTVQNYFGSEEAQERALQACCHFLCAIDWAVNDRLRLYDDSRHAFDPAFPADDALRRFRQIYDELVRPAPAGGWGIGRNASGRLWTAEETFEFLKAEFSNLPWGGPVNLLNFENIQTSLLSSLEKMSSFKPLLAKWPTMAVSKVLHFYNAELFPVYDNAVIDKKVLTRFKNEFKDFCLAFSPPYHVKDTAIFYRNYMGWGAHLLAAAHPRFMEVFAAWLAKQPWADLSKRHFDAKRLFATAYEYTLIGAYADSHCGGQSA